MKSLVRWQPFREFASLQSQMNRMFDNFFGRTPLAPFEENMSDWEFGPPVDIYEDDQKITFKVEMPGIDEKDIKVEIDPVAGLKPPERGVEIAGNANSRRTSKRKISAAWSVAMACSRVLSRCQAPRMQRRLRPTTPKECLRSRCPSMLKPGQSKLR